MVGQADIPDREAKEGKAVKEDGERLEQEAGLPLMDFFLF